MFVSIVTLFGGRPTLIFGRTSEEDKIYLQDAMKSVIQNAWMHTASLLFGPHIEEGRRVVRIVVLTAFPSRIN